MFLNKTTRTVCAAALLTMPPSTALAHGDAGHSHDQPAAPVEQHTSPTFESTGRTFELVAVNENDRLTIYLDRRDTTEPVANATVEIEIDGKQTVVAKQKSPGTYEIHGDWLQEHRPKTTVITVMAGNDIDLLNGTLPAPTEAQVDKDVQLTWPIMLKSELTWIAAGLAGLLGFAVAFAFRPVRIAAMDSQPEREPNTKNTGTAPPGTNALILALLVPAALASMATITEPARAHSNHNHEVQRDAQQSGVRIPKKLPNGQIFLPKPTQRLLGVRTQLTKQTAAQPATELVGKIIANPSYEGRVQAPMGGEIHLPEKGVSHVGQQVKQGQTLALLAPSIPVFDLGSLQQAIADVTGKITLAELRLSRLTRIRGVVAGKDIEDTKAELEALREQKKVLAPKDNQLMKLDAPIGGVISKSNIRAGQVVNAQETLFEIVDPKKLWVEVIGITSTDDPTIGTAHALDAEDHRIELTFMGRSPALRDHGRPLLFRVEDPHEALVIGTVVKILAQKGAKRRGIIVPESAVVRGSNGLQKVWIKVAPETFEPRDIRVEQLDGERVLITGGLEPGSRVVIQAAEIVNQVR